MTLREQSQQEIDRKRSLTVGAILRTAADRVPQYSFIGIFEVDGNLIDRRYTYKASGSAALLLSTGERSELFAELLGKETVATAERYNPSTQATAFYIYV